MGLHENVQKALSSGYTADQIWERLQSDSRITQALSKGYNEQQIKDRLGLSSQKSIESPTMITPQVEKPQSELFKRLIDKAKTAIEYTTEPENIPPALAEQRQMADQPWPQIQQRPKIPELRAAKPLTVQERKKADEYEKLLNLKAGIKELRTAPNIGDQRIQAYAQGIFPIGSKNINPYLTNAFPLSTLAGKLTGLLGSYGLTGGIEKAVAENPDIWLQLQRFGGSDQVTNIIASAARRATAWGGKSLADQITKVVTGDKPTAKNLLGKPATSATFGAILGGTHGIEETIPRVLTAAGAGGAWETIKKYAQNGKLSSSDISDIGLNAALVGLIEAIGSRNLTEYYKQRGMNDYLHNKMVTKLASSAIPEGKLSFEQAEQITNSIWGDNGLIQGLYDKVMNRPAYIQQLQRYLPEGFNNLPFELQEKLGVNLIDNITSGMSIEQALNKLGQSTEIFKAVMPEMLPLSLRQDRLLPSAAISPKQPLGFPIKPSIITPPPGYVPPGGGPIESGIPPASQNRLIGTPAPGMKTPLSKIIGEQKLPKIFEGIEKRPEYTEISKKKKVELPIKEKILPKTELQHKKINNYNILRIGSENEILTPSKKPQGLYVSIINNPSTFRSPHTDVGNVNYSGIAKPVNPLIAKETIITHRRFGGSSGPVGSGIAALKQLLPSKEFDSIISMSKKELIDLLTNKFPEFNYKKAYDSYELLEMYGGQLAKQRGYDSIILRDKQNKNFDEMVILDDSIVSFKGGQQQPEAETQPGTQINDIKSVLKEKQSQPPTEMYTAPNIKKSINNINFTKDDRFISYREGIKGKNNNKLVAYQHIRKPSEKYSKYEGGLVSSKESDWDRAVNCTKCNRKIVHVYWVKNKEGLILPYGQEHLHEAIGYQKPITKGQAENLRSRLEIENQNKNVRINELKSRAEGVKDKSTANYKFFEVGYKSEHLPESSLYLDKNGNYIRALKSEGELLKEIGFSEVKSEIDTSQPPPIEMYTAPNITKAVQTIRNLFKPKERNEVLFQTDTFINGLRAADYGQKVRFKNNLKAVPDEVERQRQGLELLQGGHPQTPVQKLAVQLFEAWGDRAVESGWIPGKIENYRPFMTKNSDDEWKEVNRILGRDAEYLKRVQSVDPRFSTWSPRKIGRKSESFADYQRRLDAINKSLAEAGSDIRLEPETDIAKLLYRYEQQVTKKVLVQEFMNAMEQYHDPVTGKSMFLKNIVKVTDPDYREVPEKINIKTGFYRKWNPRLNEYERIEYKYYIHKNLYDALVNWLSSDVGEDLESAYKKWVNITNLVKRLKLFNPLPLRYQKMFLRTLASQVRIKNKGGPLGELFKDLLEHQEGTVIKTPENVILRPLSLSSKSPAPDIWKTGKEAMENSVLIEDAIAHGLQWREEFEEETKAPEAGETIFHESLSKFGLSKQWVDKMIGNTLKINRLQEYVYRFRDYRRKGLSYDDAKTAAAHDANEMTYAQLRHRQRPRTRAILNAFSFSKNSIDNALSRFKRLAGQGATKGLFTPEQIKAMSEEEWKKALGTLLIAIGIGSAWNKKVVGRWFNTGKDTIGKIAIHKNKKGEVYYLGFGDWLTDYLYLATGQTKKFLAKGNPIAIEFGQQLSGREWWSDRKISEYPVASKKGITQRIGHAITSVGPDESIIGVRPIKRAEGMEVIQKIRKQTELRRMEERERLDKALDKKDYTKATKILLKQGKTDKQILKVFQNEATDSRIRSFSRASLDDKFEIIKAMKKDGSWKNIPAGTKAEMMEKLEKANLEAIKRRRAR